MANASATSSTSTAAQTAAASAVEHNHAQVKQSSPAERSPQSHFSARRHPSWSLPIDVLYVPALILFAVFMLYPLIAGLGLSFTDWDGFNPGRAFVGLKNYVTLFLDVNFRVILVNTLIYGVGSTILQQVLGLALAMTLNHKFRGTNLIRAIIYLPALVSAAVMGTMYYFVFQYEQGALNTMLQWFGLSKQAWFQNQYLAIAIVVVVNSVQFVGVSMIIYLAGLQTIDQSVMEAAAIDGASGWNLFRNVTLPLLRPAFTTSVVINLIGGLKLYDVIQVLTGGGPGYSTNSMSTYIGVVYFDNQSAGYASAIGIVLFVFIAVITVVVNKLLDRWK